MKYAVQVRQTGTKAIDEFMQHEIAIGQMLAVLINLIGDRLEKLRLHAIECFGGTPASLRESRIGVLPLLQLSRSLLLRTRRELGQLGKQLVLTLLAGDELSEQLDLNDVTSARYVA